MTENDEKAAQFAAVLKQLEVWTATAESHPWRDSKRTWWEVDGTRPWPDVFASESDAMARLAEAAAHVAPPGEARMPAIAFANHLRRVCLGRTLGQGRMAFGESGLEPYRWQPTEEEVDELLALSRRFEDFLHAYMPRGSEPLTPPDQMPDDGCATKRKGKHARRRAPKPQRRRAKPAMAKADKELCTLLVQDYVNGWGQQTLHAQDKDLLQRIGRKHSGAMRPDRRPHFEALREHWRKDPKAKPWDLLRDLPDEGLREDLLRYLEEAGCNVASDK